MTRTGSAAAVRGAVPYEILPVPLP
jgi:hypothetical protein